MIFTRLNGGLGNQLFQYAAGFALAEKLGTRLVLDTRIYENSKLRQYELGHFSITAKVGANGELPPSQSNPVGYVFWRYLQLSPKIFRERRLGFDNALLELGDQSYLHGYWQSELYFADVQNRIRQEYQFNVPARGLNVALLDTIGASTGVSLHVRRGDYLSSSGGENTHGTCTADYYANAVRALEARLEEPFTIYVFSDEPQWARDNLKFIHKTVIVDANDGAHGFEDLRLMAACDHHIIANSSFSWWGAWLNPSTDKIVIAPERWYASSKVSNPDICPPNWVRVSSNRMD